LPRAGPHHPQRDRYRCGRQQGGAGHRRACRYRNGADGPHGRSGADRRRPILEAFHWSWDSLVGTIEKWNKGATTPEATVPLAETMVRTWYAEVFPYLNPVGVEKSFEFVLYEDEGRRIILHGTRDLDEADLTWDWKTGQHDERG
jgi:hypothetical protein